MKLLFGALPAASLVVGAVLSTLDIPPIEHMLIAVWIMMVGLVIYSRTVSEDTMLTHIIKLRCSCGSGMLIVKISALVGYLVFLAWFFGCIIPQFLKVLFGSIFCHNLK